VLLIKVQLPKMITLRILITWLLFNSTVANAQETFPVFISGTEGYKSFRIPAIIKLPDNSLLAFCEGRLKGAADFGDINIVMKRSMDQGVTWSSLQKIVDADTLQAGNAAPVVDLTDPQYPNGRVFLFYNTGNNHESELRKGNGLREVWYICSADGGTSWTAPVNITTQVHRPRQPLVNTSYNFTEDWRTYANTPGHALQFGWGRYKGRIYIAANHSQGAPKKAFEDYAAHGYYTDDHGKTFHLSESVNFPGSNEATAAQIDRHGLLLNCRNQQGRIRARIVAKSNDGGQTWSYISADPQLPDPICEGSLLNIGTINGKHILAFCNAADTAQRNNLTLRISYNGGRSWARNIPIDKTTEKKTDFTAYSDIVFLNKNQIGVLYERDGYREIVFRVVDW